MPQARRHAIAHHDEAGLDVEGEGIAIVPSSHIWRLMATVTLYGRHIAIERLLHYDELRDAGMSLLSRRAHEQERHVATTR